MGEAVVDEARGRGVQAGGLLVEVCRRLLSRPAVWKKWAGEPRVLEEELAPLVHEHASRGVRLARRRRAPARAARGTRRASGRTRRPARRGPRRAGPARPDRPARRRGSRPPARPRRRAALRPRSRGGEPARSRCSAGRIRGTPVRPGAARGRCDQERGTGRGGAMSRPSRRTGCGRSGPRLRRAAGPPVWSGRTPARSGVGRVRASPAGPSATRPCGRPDRRFPGGPGGGRARRRAPARHATGCSRRRRRTTPTWPA